MGRLAAQQLAEADAGMDSSAEMNSVRRRRLARARWASAGRIEPLAILKGTDV